MKTTTNTRAVTQLRTWLTSVGIEIREQSGNETVVVNATGQEQKVTVVVGDAPAGREIVVAGSELTSRKLKDGFDAFMGVQRALGFEAKMPVDRGAIPDHKLANNADINLAAFRHTEFRKSPDPAAETFQRYDKAITRACWKFFRANERRCTDNMYGIEDLKTYAQVWLTNFVGLYELKMDVADIHSQNEGLLFTYLSQRFEDFRKLMVTKEKNELPMLDDAFIGTRGRTYDYSNKEAWFGDEILIEEEISEEGPEFIDMSTAKGRAEFRSQQSDSRGELDERLGALGHDKMVELLTEAAGNNRIHPDAAALAETRLEAHKAECPTCIAAAAIVTAEPAPALTVRGTPIAPVEKMVERTLIVDEEGALYATPGEVARIIGGIHKNHVKAILAGQMKSFRGHTFKWVTVEVPSTGGYHDRGSVHAGHHFQLK